MGMFDYVEITSRVLPCGQCGAPLSGFQTKDGECLLLHLEEQDLDTARICDFHTICETCNTFNTFSRTLTGGLDTFVCTEPAPSTPVEDA